MEGMTEPARNEVALAIGDRVKLIRAHFQITQRELAKRLVVSPGYLSDVENRNNKANADMLVGLALYFSELNIDWVLTGRGQMILHPAHADQKDDYALDIEAISTVQRLFYDELSGKSDRVAAQLIADEAYFFNRTYVTYMAHYHAFLAQGMGETAARAAARTECKQLDKREMR